MGRQPVKPNPPAADRPNPAAPDDPKLATAEYYTAGPLPPAAELERIERLAPGATERIIAMVEKQQEHRTQWENKAREAHSEERRRAQLYALVFALCGLATALVFGILNQPTAATVIGSTTIGGVVASFILGVRGGLPQETADKGVRGGVKA
jgi:uncharacterized membrane protein